MAENYDVMDPAAQEAARQSAEEKAQALARQEIEDLKWVMQNRRGRRFAYKLLERAGVWRSSFHTNALTMAFNEGTRNEGLALLDKVMTHCPDLYGQMLKEHTDNE